MINRNLVLSKFWALWEFKSKQQNCAWNDFTKSFNDFYNFEDSVNDEIEKLSNLISIFELSNNSNTKVKILQRALYLFDEWEQDGIKSIVKDDFHLFPSLANIKNVNWFFYKGDVQILKKDTNYFISIIGSRNTGKEWKEWIRDFMPKDKIVISGLANGADVMGHQVAMEYKQKIVVFPAVDIFKMRFPENDIKQKIINYATNGQGIIMTDVFPTSKSYDKTLFLKRNRWMAQMSSETYVVYFDGVSGTLGQMVETLKLNRKIFLPKKVWELNEFFLDEHKSFENWRERIEEK